MRQRSICRRLILLGAAVVVAVVATASPNTSEGSTIIQETHLFTPAITITTSFELPQTTGSTTGVIYKGATRFIHNFQAAGTDGFNLFLGDNAGNFTMWGGNPHQTHHASYNTGVGVEALLSNTTGNANTASGFSTLLKNTTGFRNTANGTWALLDNTTGSANTASGVDALRFNTTGGLNTAYGLSALYKNTEGSANTAIGADALVSNITGEANVALGFRAGNNITSGSNNIVIGYDIDAPSATASNQMSIGNLIFATGVDGTGSTISSGNVGIGTAAPQSAFQVTGYVQLDLTAGSPPASDCDQASERGRMKVDNASGLLYVCVDSGWVAK